MRILFLVLFIISTSFSLDKTSYFASGIKFDVKHFVLPTENKDSLDLFVFYRVSYDAQIFKNIGSDIAPRFQSNAKIELIGRDYEGIIRYKDQNKFSTEVSSYENTLSKSNFSNGFISFRVKNRKHDFTASFVASNSSEPIEIEFTQLKWEDDQIVYPNPIFVKYSEKSLLNMQVYINKSGFNFGATSSRLIIPVDEYDNQSLYFTLKQNKKNKDDEEGSDLLYKSQFKNLDGNVDVISYNSAIFKNQNNFTYLSIDESKNSNNYFYSIDLPVDQLTPGEYTLEIYSDDKVAFVHIFNVSWENKPISLSDIDFATEKMYYILDDEQFSDLKDGSDERKYENLISYWQNIDPTPQTPYNESMNQYFGRVDFAFFNFATLAERDGADTDKGKIFILNGMPSKITNDTEGENRFEIWQYQNLNKEYKFKLISSGIFKLVEIIEI
jgi:GWxTD domain-containing protein